MRQNPKEGIIAREKSPPRQPAELRTRRIRLFKENRADCSSDNAAYAAVAEKLVCSRHTLREYASKRSTTPIGQNSHCVEQGLTAGGQALPRRLAAPIRPTWIRNAEKRIRAPGIGPRAGHGPQNRFCLSSDSTPSGTFRNDELQVSKGCPIGWRVQSNMCPNSDNS